jgi:cytochrome c-type biogenesis protein
VLETILITVNNWMTGGAGIAALGCFLWGVISVVLSPCHMASIPLIVSYVAGQERQVRPRGAAHYAMAFTTGLFITIAIVGVICSLLGRMMGEIGPWWTVFVGAILIWVALDMLGVKSCSLSGSLMGGMRVRGVWGAFVLGLAYGVLSGSCTFGFIAPILALVTLQQEIARGALMILLFGVGHCVPIAIAGSSAALVRRLLHSDRFHQGGLWFRRLAGVAIAGMGVYFIVRPFVEQGAV